MNKKTMAFLTVATLIFFFSKVYAAAPNGINQGPLNPAFTNFMNEQLKTLGYIPSPIPPEIHQPQVLQLWVVDAYPKYDMRDPNNDGNQNDSLLTPVKNQGACGSCWAFGTYGSLESQIKKDFFMEEIYSENNLKQLHGFDLGPCADGNIHMSSAYLSRYDGPISALDDPYDPSEFADYCVGCPPVRYIDNLIFLPARLDTSDNDFIKQAILDHGGVFTSFYWNSSYYNSGNHTYYYNGSNIPNHGVVAVGWDDNMVTGASKNGAFIIRNSWGSGWGESGYFYISYEDTSLAFETSSYFDEKADSDFDFNTVFYHDALGWVSSYGYGTSTAHGANLFTTDGDGRLTGVGFYATASNMSYEIKIYDHFNGSSFTSQLGSTQTGTFSYAGWYTVKLEQPVDIIKNDDFGVIVKFTTPGYDYPLPIEAPLAGYSSAASAGAGESYISSNGSTWSDIGDNDNWNLNIKAYANINKCNIDYADDLDNDGDVEGADLAMLVANNNFSYLSDFAAHFGVETCYR